MDLSRNPYWQDFPFKKLYAQARRGDPADAALLNALGDAFYAQLVKPKRVGSGFGGGTLSYVGDDQQQHTL